MQSYSVEAVEQLKTQFYNDLNSFPEPTSFNLYYGKLKELIDLLVLCWDTSGSDTKLNKMKSILEELDTILDSDIKFEINVETLKGAYDTVVVNSHPVQEMCDRW